jgi:hypothetical protein
MSTKHKLRATIPHGDPDLGMEIDVEIAFTYLRGSPDYYNKAGGHWEQGWGAEIELVNAVPMVNGKLSPGYSAWTIFERETLNDLAQCWLDSDEGRAEALEAVQDDDEAAREYAAEAKRDARWEQP